jgi:predicted MFS family arabinose efflux permease
VNSHPLLSDRYRTRFVAILFVVCVFNLADRAVLNVLAPLIRQDLKLSDTQIGLLQGLSFALLYGGLGIPIGRLAERVSRVGIIAMATAFWSAATAFCGLANNFVQMLLARVGVGMGEAGFTAPTSSLVADHFPRERRASGMALIMLGIPMGSMLGALLAGFIAERWGWRVAFFSFGIPGMLVAALVWFGLKEPPRGLADGSPPARGPIPSLGRVLNHLWTVPSLRSVVLGAAVCSIGVQGVAQFMMFYFMRQHQLPVSTASILFGLVSGIALSVGMLMGGLGTDRASARDVRWWVIAPAIVGLLTTLVFIAGFQSTTLKVSVLLIGLGCCGAMIHYGPTVGLIQNLTPVNMRTSASAVFAMLYALIGTGLGPTFVGLASDAFAQDRFTAGVYGAACRPGSIAPEQQGACVEAARFGMVQSLSVVVIAFAVASLFYWWASRSLRADLSKGSVRS